MTTTCICGTVRQAPVTTPCPHCPRTVVSGSVYQPDYDRSRDEWVRR